MDASNVSQPTDGLDSSHNSLLPGTSGTGSGSNVSTYPTLPSDLKEQWMILEEAKSIPFSKWDLQATLAWMELSLGEWRGSRLCRYG